MFYSFSAETDFILTSKVGSRTERANITIIMTKYPKCTWLMGKNHPTEIITLQIELSTQLIAKYIDGNGHNLINEAVLVRFSFGPNFDIFICK